MSDTVAKPRSTQKVERPPMWTVVFLNDDFTPMAFVVHVLMKVFHLSAQDATHIMMRVHREGTARVGSYTRDVVNHKVDYTLSMAAAAQHPLQVYPEPIE